LVPAIAIARGDMLEYQNSFQTALSLALYDETEQPGGDVGTRELLNEIRYAWSQMIAAYRLYLINRIASLAESHLDIQAQDVDTIHDNVTELLAQLVELDRDGRLSLVTSTSLVTLRDAAEQWYEGFQRVVAINLTEGWRADVPYFRETIEPLLSTISARIGVLDAMLTDAGRQDVADVASVATRVSTGLWWAALALLALIAVGLYVFEGTVLRPFSYLAEALKKEALGAENVPLPSATTHETRDLVTAFSELQRQIRARQTELEHQALHDALTALPNRTLLRDRLNQAVASAHRERGSLALLMIDLDRFKQINDTLGHPVGDRVLQQVARRLTGLLRESDTVARLGGDEFALLLPSARRVEAEGVAQKVLHALDSPLSVGEHQLVVGASLGIALYPQHGRSADALVQHADIAMYAAKRGRVGWLVYGNDARVMNTPS
jgi:diguanylate cyclase (GGDEF)-like protein